jgi:hypothetical protein
MSKSSESRAIPSAIIHKKILDAAADNPDASMEALASEVPSATTDLIERVLEEYGDPGADESDTSEPSISGAAGPRNMDGPSAKTSINQAASTGSSTISKKSSRTGDKEVNSEQQMTESDTDDSTISNDVVKSNLENQSSNEEKSISSETDGDSESIGKAHPEVDELSTKQKKVLEAIYNNPGSSQRELADILDVSGSTISNRANSIQGFSWENRDEFAKSVFEGHTDTLEQNDDTMATQNTNLQKEVSELGERIDSLEQKFEAATQVNQSELDLDDSELLHKIIHACLNSDSITKEEELKLLETIIQ